MLYGCTCNYTPFQGESLCEACDELAQSVEGFVRHMTADRTCQRVRRFSMLSACPSRTSLRFASPAVLLLHNAEEEVCVLSICMLISTG